MGNDRMQNDDISFHETPHDMFSGMDFLRDFCIRASPDDPEPEEVAFERMKIAARDAVVRMPISWAWCKGLGLLFSEAPLTSYGCARTGRSECISNLGHLLHTFGFPVSICV